RAESGFVYSDSDDPDARGARLCAGGRRNSGRFRAGAGIRGDGQQSACAPARNRDGGARIMKNNDEVATLNAEVNRSQESEVRSQNENPAPLICGSSFLPTPDFWILLFIVHRSSLIVLVRVAVLMVCVLAVAASVIAQDGVPAKDRQTTETPKKSNARP